MASGIDMVMTMGLMLFSRRAVDLCRVGSCLCPASPHPTGLPATRSARRRS